MPQAIRQSIGFSDQSYLDRLRSLPTLVGASQSTIIEALISLPNEQIVEIVGKYALVKNAKKDARKTLADSLKGKKLKELSPEQLAKIQEILDGAT